MGRVSTESDAGPSVGGVSCVAGKSADDKSVGDDWFSSICRVLHPVKAGTILHLQTGFDERSCQRYAAGSVQPPGYFIRALLRCGDGETYARALMDGSTATWWRDLQRNARIGAAVLELTSRG